jgi:hypothetical protein
MCRILRVGFCRSTCLVRTGPLLLVESIVVGREGQTELTAKITETTAYCKRYTRHHLGHSSTSGGRFVGITEWYSLLETEKSGWDPYITDRQVFSCSSHTTKYSINFETMTNHPPLFEFDPGFPLVWCDKTGKLHSDKGNATGKFPRNCPFCNCRYTNFQSWQQHVGHDHHCQVTLTDTKEQRIKKDSSET